MGRESSVPFRDKNGKSCSHKEGQRTSRTTGQMPCKGKREIAREVKGNGNFRATEVKGGETFEGDRVDSSIREVKWNDPERCLLEFQEEVTELFKK